MSEAVQSVRNDRRPHVSRFDEKARPIIEADEAPASHCRMLLDVRGYLLRRLPADGAARVIVVSCNDPVCKLLMTAPGIGPITALSFKAGIDDPNPVPVFSSCRSALWADAEVPAR
jgi:transposase